MPCDGLFIGSIQNNLRISHLFVIVLHMTIKTLDKSKNTTINKLRNEVGLLRSFVIGRLGKDPEGEYKPEFVERILKTSASDKIEHIFKDEKSLRSYLNANKN